MRLPHSRADIVLHTRRGLIGPARQFDIGDYYNPILFWMLAGAILPIITWLLVRRYPNSWVRLISVPAALAGATFMPPATGINYSSSVLMCFIFRESRVLLQTRSPADLASLGAEFVIRHRFFKWWSKYNFILSAGLDAGTVVCGIVIFLTLQLPKGGTICASPLPFARPLPTLTRILRSAQLVGQLSLHQHARLARRLVQDGASGRVRSDVVVGRIL